MESRKDFTAVFHGFEKLGGTWTSLLNAGMLEGSGLVLWSLYQN